MCDHEEILDSEGYVCIKCGIVLGQQYIYEENSYDTQINRNKDIGIYSTINNILEHLQLNTPSYADEVNDLIDKYLSNLKCKSELKIGACVYYLISSSGLACQLNRISGLVCSNVNDSKKLFKLIQIFPQEHILSNNISKLAELLLSYSNFERADRCKISQLTNTLVCKYCSYSQITKIAGISYWYFKLHIKQKNL